VQKICDDDKTASGYPRDHVQSQSRLAKTWMVWLCEKNV